MNFIEEIIGPFFENASSVFEAFLDIIISFFGLGFVAIRVLGEILGGSW